MSDHHTPHPVDRAYAEAEAMLDDEAARRARRARVLEALAREPASQATTAPARVRKAYGWRYVGWLTAASIAGLGGLIAYQLSPTAGLPPVALPGEVSSGPTPPSAASPPPAPDVQVEVRAEVQDSAAPAAPARSAPPPEEGAPEAARNAAAPMAPPMPVAPPPVVAPEAASPPPAAFPAAQERLESAEGRRAAAAPVAAPAPSARVQGAAASPAALGARLRAAAAAGRTSEVAELLAEGAPVDARDSDGETALMKSIRANQPATAALLRRRGADPDLESRAGVSARDMAQAAGNAALERALAPER